ncbi:MAG: hypothetical protein JSR76_06655 [Verrucomicrobia bacterium]|nr:hypothetical protein [Verrucomicrobiota bacterium]
MTTGAFRAVDAATDSFYIARLAQIREKLQNSDGLQARIEAAVSTALIATRSFALVLISPIYLPITFVATLLDKNFTDAKNSLGNAARLVVISFQRMFIFTAETLLCLVAPRTVYGHLSANPLPPAAAASATAEPLAPNAPPAAPALAEAPQREETVGTTTLRPKSFQDIEAHLSKLIAAMPTENGARKILFHERAILRAQMAKGLSFERPTLHRGDMTGHQYRKDAKTGVFAWQARSGKTDPLSNPFASKPTVHFSMVKYFYDHTRDFSGKKPVLADFANMSFGGGAWTPTGRGQEEGLLVVAPTLGTLLGEEVRSGHQSAGSGSPNPILAKAVPFYGTLRSTLTGFAEKSESTDTADLYTAYDTPIPTDVVAVAAPRLYSEGAALTKEQFSMTTLTDLANSFLAACLLVKQHSPDARLHSGKLGAGVFKNNPIVVALVQRLIAQHVGVELVLHGYNDAEATAARMSWDEVGKGLPAGATLTQWLETIHTKQGFIMGRDLVLKAAAAAR